MKITTGVLILLFYTSVFAQKSKDYRFVDSISTGRFSLNVSPLSLFDMYNGSAYRFGAQYSIIERISIGAEGGGYIEPITQLLCGFFNIKGYHYRGRIALHPKQFPNWSFGLEYQYKEQRFSYMDSTETETSFQADVSKKARCASLFIAYNHHFSQRIFLDIQCGFGLRYRDVYNTRSDVVGEESITFPWDSMHTGRVKTGQSYLPNLSLTLRIWYVLVKE